MIAVVLVVLEVVSLAAGQLLIKRGIDAAGGFMMQGDSLLESLVSLFREPIFIFGLGMYAAATLLWFYLLARYDLSFIYPFVSLTFVVASVGGWLLLGEPITAPRVLGVTIIAVGVVIITRS